MSGLRLRIVFIVSLGILGLLVVFTIFRPMATGEQYSEVVQESIIQLEDQWIIKFSIINRESKEVNYTINWSTGGKTYSQTIPIKNGRMFTHIHHVYPETVKEGQVNLTVYKEGETTPFEQSTYYIQFD